jgi:hypothetical protein
VEEVHPAATQIPEKPPRKISGEKLEEIPKGAAGKKNKVFEAPKVDDSDVVAHRSKSQLTLKLIHHLIFNLSSSFSYTATSHRNLGWRESSSPFCCSS